jgi:hypothetical protein
MSNLIWKLGLLPGFLARGFVEWKTLIWRADPDQYYCCDGRECCCGGISMREAISGEKADG